MENQKLSIRRATTAFGLAIQDAIDKGKGSISAIEQYRLEETQENPTIEQQINHLVKEILRPEETKKASLERKRAKANNTKTKNKKASTTEPAIVDSLKKQISSASKEISELRKKLAENHRANLESHQKKLLQKALVEINKFKERAETLEKENKALRQIIEMNLAKSLPQSREMVFYGGQYSDAET